MSADERGMAIFPQTRMRWNSAPASRGGFACGYTRLLVRSVVHPVLQRHVQRVILAIARPDILDVPGPRKEIAVLMEGHRHDPIRQVKRLFHPVAVVNVDVDVQDARVELQELLWGFIRGNEGGGSGTGGDRGFCS